MRRQAIPNSSIPATSILIITGPVGVGKTTVSDAVSELLTEQNIPCAMIDIDALRWAYPRPKDDPFHTKLGLMNLGSIWPNYKELGIEHLIIPNVIESREDIVALRNVIPDSIIFTVRLQASIPTLHKRLTHREFGESLEWHKKRAVELTNHYQNIEVADALIDTERKTVHMVATEVLQAWRAH